MWVFWLLKAVSYAKTLTSNFEWKKQWGHRLVTQSYPVGPPGDDRAPLTKSFESGLGNF